MEFYNLFSRCFEFFIVHALSWDSGAIHWIKLPLSADEMLRRCMCRWGTAQ